MVPMSTLVRNADYAAPAGQRPAPPRDATRLAGLRIFLRPLLPSDWDAWRAVRTRNHAWVEPWESADASAAMVDDAGGFADWCGAWAFDWERDTGFGFGLFLSTGALIGEIGIGAVQRAGFHSANLGYWIDEAHAGHGYVPEGLVVVLRFAFEQLALHRLEALIMPSNAASVRVVEKLGLRNEGVAVRLGEVRGEFVDLARYALTLEEWRERRRELIARFVAAA
jgi:ribosomal-protein-alanine N-acetyltransferase